MVLGVVGNIHTILVYGLYYKKTKMRNFVLTLSTVDLLSCCLTDPYLLFYFSNAYKNSVFMCNVPYLVAPFLFLFSYGLLTIISVDRFKMIVTPLGRQLSLSQSRLACFACGLFVFVLALPLAFIQSYSKDEQFIPERNVTIIQTSCKETDVLFKKVYGRVVDLFEGSCILICFAMYVSLGVFLRMKSKGMSVKIDVKCCELRTLCCCAKKHSVSVSSSSPNADDNQNHSNNKRKANFIKGMRTSVVFFVVTFVSCLCLVPNLILTKLSANELDYLRNNLNNWLDILAHIVFINTTVNPILYVLVDSKFRERSKLLYKSCCKFRV